MERLLMTLDPLLPFAVGLAALASLADFRKKGGFAPARPLLVVILGLLTVRCIAFWSLNARPPLASPAEAFATITLAIVFVSAWLVVVHRERTTGFSLLAAATVAQTAALFSTDVTGPVDELLRERWFGFHAVSAILGYTAFAVSSAYAVLFVVLYTQLKRKRFGLTFDRMPSLDVLERTSIRSSTLGFVFLTAAIVAGMFGWARVLDHSVWADPKVLSTMIAWVVYGVGVALWHVAGWRGIRTIGLTLIAFGLLVLSSWIVPWILGSSHGGKGLV